MFKTCIDRLIGKLILKESIKEDDKELYAYGLEVAFGISINILTTIFIGIFFGMVLESMVFLLIYIPIRSYSGGYHANSNLKCYFLSCLLILFVLVVISYMPDESYVNIIIGIICIATPSILILAPIEDYNKPIDDKERQVFKHKIRLISSFYIVISIMCIGSRMKKIAMIIAISMLMVSVILFLGKVKNVCKITQLKKDESLQNRN